jgi:hypothetical protein
MPLRADGDRLPGASRGRLGRREVTLAGVAGVSLLVTGCTVEHGTARTDRAAPRPENPDQGLVAAALGEEHALVERVRRTRRRHRTLRGHLGEVLRVHEAHVRLLAGTVPSPGTTPAREPSVPGTPAAALAALVEAEETLRHAHVAGALRADSGPFARVLAGMAAAAAQQGVVLGELDSGLSKDGPGG